MIKWNQYTWYSRLVTLIFFAGVFPALAFYIGIQYEKTLQTIYDSERSIELPNSKVF